jgi:hypothetical protein
MTNYSDHSHLCEVIVFRVDEIGRPYKWNLTEAVSFAGLYEALPDVAFDTALARHFEGRCAGQVAICPDPYSKYNFPWVSRIPARG